MEVNHIEPLNGRGYHIGCVHHLDNLQTLCHGCHGKVTLQQRSERNRRENKSVAILGVAKNLKSFAAGVQRAASHSDRVIEGVSPSALINSPSRKGRGGGMVHKLMNRRALV